MAVLPEGYSSTPIYECGAEPLPLRIHNIILDLYVTTNELEKF